MHSRATHLIARLALRPHPEGGYFSEVYRSPSRVKPDDERAERAALTTIYFLLTAGDVSRWHRVASDEVWHFYEGDPLELFIVDAAFDELARVTLGPVGDRVSPVHVVTAHRWQAARSTGAYTLVGCTVGPGFEFADFQLIRDLPAESAHIAQLHPEAAQFI